MTRIACTAALALSTALLTSLALPAAAATETVLYSFHHAALGEPHGRLHFVGSSLFGTGSGGDDGKGQVFELTNSGGSWSETTILAFDGTDGEYPEAGLIDSGGTFLFGTAQKGDMYGSGNAFILSNLGGSWTSATVWAFGGVSGDGSLPDSDLIMDSSGALYGTTYVGGASDYGTVFQLTENFSTWSESVLYSFKGGSDGDSPVDGVVMDTSGALYGVTPYGGKCQYCGVAYELSQSGGVWKETILHKFAAGTDGSGPSGPLVEDSSGNFYGTTTYGGNTSCQSPTGCGTVFELYISSGVWKKKNVYKFPGGSNGMNPAAGLAIDASGSLYGTTVFGGGTGCGGIGCGTVFKLSLSSGKWKETVLHRFSASGGDGTEPVAAVILDSAGSLYGTTQSGGANGDGAVYEVTP